MNDNIDVVELHRCFGGEQLLVRHNSHSNNCKMEFAIYLPPQAKTTKCPVLYWLSGLTCTWENFTTKAGAQRYAAEKGLVLVAADTSPRGTNLPGEHENYDFGSGAGFYVDATESPWSQHYNMYSYITQELPTLVEKHFSILPNQKSISGHSMGGHGALVCALRNPELYVSVSAIAPIVNPSDVPWGQNAFKHYLGSDQNRWKNYDACNLIQNSLWNKPILIDQGTSDEFLQKQLQPEKFELACRNAGIDLTLRSQNGYDHSYYAIASFIGDHINWHTQ